MRYSPLLLLALATALSAGCSSTPTDPEHVLSGDAPVATVVERADEAARSGDDHAASILYQQALRRAPDADVWYRFGTSLDRLGRPDEALWAYRNALELDAHHLDALQAAGIQLTTQDRPEEARPLLERLVERHPDNWRAHNALGVVADLEGRFDEARDSYTTAIVLNPDSPMLWNNLGYSQYLAGNYDAAIRNIGNALRLDPAYRSARHNIALVFARQANYELALNAMLSIEEEAQAYCDVGYLAYKMGDYAVAENLLTQAIQRSATYHRQAHDNLAAVRHAMAEDRRG